MRPDLSGGAHQIGMRRQIHCYTWHLPSDLTPAR